MASRLGHAATYVAGVPNNFSTMKPAQKAWEAVKAPVRAAVNPNYPGLDRPVGISKSVLNTRPGPAGVPLPSIAPQELARPLDRTRQAAATAMRSASRGVTVGTAAAGAYGTMYQYPGQLASQIGQNAGFTQQQEEQTKANLSGTNMLRTGWDVAKDFAAPAKDPMSQLHRDVIGQTAVPQVQYDLHSARARNPLLYGALDTIRSFTPAGAITTAAMRAASSDKEPPFNQALNSALKKHAPAIADPANADAVERSPYTKMWDRVLPMSRASALGGAAVSKAYESTYPAQQKLENLIYAGKDKMTEYAKTVRDKAPAFGNYAYNRINLAGDYAAGRIGLRGLDEARQLAGQARTKAQEVAPQVADNPNIPLIRRAVPVTPDVVNPVVDTVVPGEAE